MHWTISVQLDNINWAITAHCWVMVLTGYCDANVSIIQGFVNPRVR